MFNKRFRRYIQDSSVVLSITSKEVGSSAGVEVVLDNGFFFLLNRHNLVHSKTF